LLGTLAVTTVVTLGSVVPPASAQDDPVPPTVTLERELSECISAAPKPGCGYAPEQPGDRGGSLQVATFAVMVGGLGVIATVVARSVRRRDRAAADAS
jgi:hypothetical protein